METFDEGGFEEVVAPEADPIAFDGQVDEGDIAPEPNYLDVDQYGEYYAKVKVDGEELEVPVTEALQGYQRQADYTRKTQELSQRAQQVQFWETVDQAMKVNPQETMRFLQNQYGIGQAEVATNTSYEEPEEDWFSDPSEKRIAQLEKQLSGVTDYFQQQQAAQQLDQVVGQLQQKYGEDFNASAVIREALNRGLNDPRYLEGVFKEMSFDRVMAKQSATADSQARQQSQAQARQRAAAEASNTVSQGSGSGGDVVTPTRATRPKSIQEAWALAKQQTAS